MTEISEYTTELERTNERMNILFFKYGSFRANVEKL